MAENNQMDLAKKVYVDLCAALDRRNWHYDRYDEELFVTSGFDSEDIPIELVIAVDPKMQILKVLSRLPFVVPEDKRMELAIATCVATYGLADGSFGLGLENGRIEFRVTASYRESSIGDGLFEYLVAWSNHIIDRYNDKFLALCKGLISIDDFIAYYNR